MALEQEDIERIVTLRRQIQFYGTEEMGYTDSGLWRFLSYVKTKDSHDKRHPVKPIPVQDKVYLKVVFLFMLCCDKLLLPKSRQIMMSWAMSAFDVWHAMQGPYRHVVYQTKKEADAFAMVTGGKKKPKDGRMDFIIQNLPGWLRDKNIESGRGNNVGELVFTPEDVDDDGIPCLWPGSRIEAVPGGADQIAGKTPSKVSADEASYHEAFAQVVIRALPAITGGGQFHAASSVCKNSDFNMLVLETMDGAPPLHETHPVVERALEILGIEWPKGMRSWKTKSGFWVLETHYTADPAKDPARDGAKWYKSASEGYPGGVDGDGWQQEMEINYNATGSRLVFPFLQQPIPKCFIGRMDPSELMHSHSFFAGYDYGTTNPSAFEVTAINDQGDLYAVWEVYQPCRNIIEHVRMIKACPYWDKLQYIAADNKIFGSRNQHANEGMRTVAELFQEAGLYMSPARQGVDYTMALKLNSEHWADPDAPRAFITEECPGLKAELRGLRLKEHKSALVAREANEPERIVDKDNHAFDAWAYSLDFRPHVFVKKETVPEHLTIREFIKRSERMNRANERRSRRGIIVA